MSRSRVRKLMTDHGFVEFDSPGFIAFRQGERTVQFFWWSNRAHAASVGVARSSLHVRAGVTEGIIPLVAWPSDEQPARPWEEVAAEILSVLELREDDQSR